MSKILVLICVSCFLLTVAGPAAAYTTVKAQETPTVSADSTVALGTLLLKEEYANSIKKGDWVTISLPSFVELQQLRFYFPGGSYWPSTDEYTVPYAVYSVGDEISLGGSGVALQKEGLNTFSLKVSAGGAPTSKTFRCYIYFDQVYIKALPPEESGKIDVTIDAPPSSGFSSGTVTVANVSIGGSTATAASPESLTDLGGEVANITLKENVPGALKMNGTDFRKKDTVKFVLSPGFTWQTVVLLPSWGWQLGDIDYAIGEDASGRSVLYLQIKKETTKNTGVGRVIISGTVSVDESIARSGKVEVSYEGSNQGVDPALLTVAEYSTAGATVKGKTVTDVVAGHSDQRIGEFTVTEGMAGDLARGRTITLTLPEGVKWNTYPAVKREAGNGELSGPVPVGDDRQTVRFTVIRSGTEKTAFCFKYAAVDLALDAPEKVDITVGGSAGARGTVTVAHVQPPVAVVAEKTTVRIGVPNQPGGKLTITENMPGAVRARDAGGATAFLRLELPEGVTFAQKPVAEVSSGDLVLDNTHIRLEQGDRVLVIPVKTSSVSPVSKPVEESAAQPESSPTGEAEEKSASNTEGGVTGSSTETSSGTETQGSTITVRDIVLTVDRTVPEGAVNLKISGSALSETEKIFAGTLNELKVPLATCGTPAPDQIRVAAVFTIGSKKYRIGSEEKEMDVEPYVKNGRTYAPIRYLALAAGLNDENILWDGSNQTVTLLGGKRVVQFRVGQKSYLLQGVPISMDVAPEIVNGRTMLPYRFVAQALGLQAEWNEFARQVIIR
ncbi:MAG: copper amine oxidase N-terminal domain-containing protein [Thermoanaerobacter sp.]|nr:copper amine oxidase N-terminal domain-containing protein [Thermoanaerobacter sp.]